MMYQSYTSQLWNMEYGNLNVINPHTLIGSGSMALLE